MKEEQQSRKKYRWAPCPSYDVVRMECWLADLAQEGLFLQAKGAVDGLFVFYEGAPRTVRYRLQAAQHAQHIWSDAECEPDQAFVALSSALGWEYLLRYGEFEIYTAQAADARELNTDPAVQALTIQAVKKRGALVPLALLLYDAIIIVWVLCACQNLLTQLLYLNPAFVGLTLLLGVWVVAQAAHALVTLSALCKRLQTKTPAKLRAKGWRNTKRYYHIERIATAALLCLWVVAAGVQYANRSAIPTNSTSTREEIAIVAENGAVHTCLLTVLHHTTPSAWYAEKVAAEYYSMDAATAQFALLDAPQTELDYIAVYSEFDIVTTVLIQEGEAVVLACLYADDAMTAQCKSEWVSAWVADFVAGAACYATDTPM